jgi:ArsR family transcriptional regulator
MAKYISSKDSEILKALGHPIRLKIVEGLLKGNGCNVNKIVADVAIPQSTVSQHLKVLKTCGIIDYRKEGVLTCYRVIDPRVRKIIEIFKK